MRAAERVEPCVQVQAVAVATVNDVAQRIKVLRGLLALGSGQPLRPWFERRFVERIGRRANLKDQCIQTQLGGAGDDRIDFAAQLLWRQSGPRGEVDVVDSRDPCRPKFCWRQAMAETNNRCDNSGSRRLRSFLRVDTRRTCHRQK